MANETVIASFARRYPVPAIDQLIEAASEALTTSQFITRSIQGQSVTIDPDQATIMLETYEAARLRRIQMDAEGLAEESVARGAAQLLDFSSRPIT